MHASLCLLLLLVGRSHALQQRPSLLDAAQRSDLHRSTYLTHATRGERTVVLRAGDEDVEAGSGDDPLPGAWRVDRARLEEQWSAGVRRRRPRFLPFAAARQWARAMHMDDEADWRGWIDDGEKRNPYVPSAPDVVYKDKGWAGWDDFLNGPIEDLSTILDPNYKRGVWLKGPLSKIKNNRER